jgi:hypothetical protein
MHDQHKGLNRRTFLQMSGAFAGAAVLAACTAAPAAAPAAAGGEAAAPAAGTGVLEMYTRMTDNKQLGELSTRYADEHSGSKLNVAAFDGRDMLTKLTRGLVLSQNGLFNGLLHLVGLPVQPFLASPDQALWSIVMMASWVGVPYWTLFLLAGLQGISQELYEAAEIDGASLVRRFTDVTFPLLRRVLVFVLVADTVANFLLFVPVLILTQGGPQLSTNTLMFEAYRRGFVYGDFGTSSAMIALLLLATLAVVAFEFWLLRSSN